MSVDHASGGRGSTTTGTAALRKRSAVSWAGEKLSSPSLVATKANPQMMTTSSARTTWMGLRARSALAQDGAAVVARIDDRGPRGHGGQVLGDLPAERLQRFDVGPLASGEETPRGGLVGRRHDDGPDEVVVGNALEEVEGHCGLRSGRLSASADHSSVAFFLNSMAFSHSSSE